MDLNHIELPASVMVNLYRASLVQPDENPAKVQPVSAALEKEPVGNLPQEWKWLGRNRKNILMIVDYSDADHLPERELSFLRGVLNACKLNIDDVAVINRYHHPATPYKDLLGYFKCNPVFLFGVEPASLGLPISFPHFQLQAFANCSFLFTPTLKEMEEDKVLKSKLWVCLRRVFGI